MARPKKEETLTKVQVRLPNNLIKILKSESEKSQITLSEIIRKRLSNEYEIIRKQLSNEYNT